MGRVQAYAALAASTDGDEDKQGGEVDGAGAAGGGSLQPQAPVSGGSGKKLGVRRLTQKFAAPSEGFATGSYKMGGDRAAAAAAEIAAGRGAASAVQDAAATGSRGSPSAETNAQ